MFADFFLSDKAMIKKYPVFFLVVLAFLLLCVRPVHASGTITIPAGYTWHLDNSIGNVVRSSAAGVTLPTISEAGVAACAAENWANSTAGTYSTNGGMCTGSNPQSWAYAVGAVCPVHSTGTAPTCTCTNPYVPNDAGTQCVNLTCPHTFAGVAVSSGLGFHLGNISGGSSYCDSWGCQVNVSITASLFNVNLIRGSAISTVCGGSEPALSSVLSVILADADPKVTGFNDAKAQEPAVADSVTAAIKTAADNSKAATDSATAALTASTAAASSKSTEVQNHLSVIQSTANSLMAAPTTEKLNTYNGAVAAYNTASAELAPLMTKMNSDYSAASVAVNNSAGVSSASAAVSAARTAMGSAMAASAQTYDAGQLAAIDASIAAMTTSTSDAIAAMAAAAAQKGNTTTTTNTVNNNTVVNNTVVNNTYNTVQNIINTIYPTNPPPVTPPVTPPTPPKLPDTNSFCVDNPTASVCVPAVDPCVDHPDRVSCADVGEGTVADNVPLETKTINVASIVPVVVGNAGSCPAPRAMVFRGQTHYFSYQTYCDFAIGIKPILLVFAWLTAAGILIGGFKQA